MCVGSHATRAKPRIVGKVTTHMRIVRVFLGSLRLAYLDMKILRVKKLNRADWERIRVDIHNSDEASIGYLTHGSFKRTR